MDGENGMEGQNGCRKEKRLRNSMHRISGEESLHEKKLLLSAPGAGNRREGGGLQKLPVWKIFSMYRVLPAKDSPGDAPAKVKFYRKEGDTHAG